MNFVEEIQAICEKRARRLCQQALGLGLEVGLRGGLYRALVSSYQARFGSVPDSLLEAIELTEDEHTLLGWVPLFTTGSVEDITAGVLGASAAGREPAK
jgi:hypothetical protein